MNVSFSHLHTHSEYSLLDGMSKVHELFDKAKTLGQPALAMVVLLHCGKHRSMVKVLELNQY